MRVIDSHRVLPGMDNVIDDLIDADAMFHLREDEWARAAHFLRVTRHDFKIRPHAGSQIGFVDHEQIGLGDPWPALARDLVSAANVDDLNREVRQFPAEARGQIVAAGLDEQNIGFELAVQFFERDEVRGNVFANRGVRTAARLHRANPIRLQRAVFHEKLTVLSRENIVRHGSHAHLFAQLFAKLKHQRRLSAADRSAYADGEGAFAEVSRQRSIAFIEVTGMLHRLVRVAVTAVFVMMSAVKKNMHSQL